MRFWNGKNKEDLHFTSDNITNVVFLMQIKLYQLNSVVNQHFNTPPEDRLNCTVNTQR